MNGIISETPLASVFCATYNHVSYIDQCLEGLVMQQTSFPFEIIIHDDASTDGTREIVREYEKKYSHLIKTICQTENQYSKGIRIHSTYTFPIAQGKYFAFCEGDDYWTDPFKLQKQVDFLEQNQDYSLAYTNFRMYIQKNGVWKEPEGGGYEGDVYEYLLKYQITCMTMTVCFRREIIGKVPQLPEGFFRGDWLIFLTAALYGRFKYLPEATGVYRVLEESASHHLSYKAACAFRSRSIKTVLLFWDQYPIAPTRENLIEKKKLYFAITTGSLLSRDYLDMKYVRFLPFPIWGVVPVIKTMLCLFCKNKVFFYALTPVMALYNKAILQRIHLKK